MPNSNKLSVNDPLMSDTITATTPVTTATATITPPGVRGYLTKAVDLVRQAGLLPQQAPEESPAVALLRDVDTLDKTKLLVVAHTLQHMQPFNRIVREHTEDARLGSRFQDIANSFRYIRED